MRRLILLLALIGLAGCDQMAVQPRSDAYQRSKLFANGMVNQTPPVGTVAQEDTALQTSLATRPAMTPALIERGRQRYDIDCVQCHGLAGDGDGSVVARGFPRPDAFTNPRLMTMTSRHVVEVITNGYGVMAAHADRVLPADRWAIAAYVQALQVSQTKPVAAAPAGGAHG
jgi:mono/diheme cytochrome c family protein